MYSNNFFGSNDCIFYSGLYDLFLVHPCDKKDNGGCEHTCTKKGMEFACECNEDFKLNKDLKTCSKGICRLTNIANCYLMHN